jgi:hypothetical protein
MGVPSLDETTAIARARLPAIGVREIERLCEQSAGWAAGLTLMLDGYRKSNSVSPGLPFAYSHPPVIALSILRSMNSGLECSQNR